MSSSETCPVQATCGGCPQLVVGHEAELEAKRQMIIAAVQGAGIDVPVAMAAPSGRFGYRNRLRMRLVDGRADFFNQAKRDGCLVVRPALWEAIETLRTVTAADPQLLAGVEHVEVRVGDEPGCVGLSLSHAVDVVPLLERLGGSWRVAHPALQSTPTLPHRVATVGGRDVWIDVPVTSFVQVNAAVNRTLVAEVLRAFDECGGETFIDLFSGAGNFAAPLVATGRCNGVRHRCIGHRCIAGVAVDTAGDAIAALDRAAVPGLRCIEADARNLAELALTPSDVVIVDPPRAGLVSGHAEVAALATKALLMIACNVKSFARDLAEFETHGLRVERITGFDMFPGTDHVETLAVLRKFGGPTDHG